MNVPAHVQRAELAPASLTPMEILNRAVEQGADVDVLEKLMGLQERWEASQARKAFDVAMAKAKAKMPTIRKNRSVGYESKKADAGRTSYKHEDFAEIARTVDPILAEHGLSYRFRTASPNDAPVSVTCIVSHELGYSEENTLSAPRDTSGSKNNIQAIGSTVTYLQRYTLKAALGLASSDDDDGRTSEGGDDNLPLTAEQAQQVRDKIAEAGADIALFCRHMGVEAVPDILQRDFKKAIGALEAKARTKTKEPAQ